MAELQFLQTLATIFLVGVLYWRLHKANKRIAELTLELKECPEYFAWEAREYEAELAENMKQE